MGQTDDLMLSTRPSGYMYTPIRRGHKPTPSQESNTLSEASCTTTLSVDSVGGGGHLSPTSYTELHEEEEDNRLHDFNDEDQDIDLPLSASRDNLRRYNGADYSPRSGNNLNYAIPSSSPSLHHNHAGNSHSRLGNNNFSHEDDEIDGDNANYNDDIASSSLPLPPAAATAGTSDDVLYIDCDGASSCGERRSTLSSSVGGASSMLSSRFRDSCDTVIPNNNINNNNNSLVNNSKQQQSSTPLNCNINNNLTSPPPTVVVSEAKRGINGSNNSDYGSYCATPKNGGSSGRNSGVSSNGGGKSSFRRTSAATSSNGGVVGSGVDQNDSGMMLGDSYQNAPLLSDMEAENLSDDERRSSDASSTAAAGNNRNKKDRGAPIKINLPSEDGDGGGGGNRNNNNRRGGFRGLFSSNRCVGSDNIPHEPWKTLLSAIFLASGFVATTTSLAITHEHVPDIDPLPDVILDNVTYTEWGLDVSEILIMISTLTAVLVVMLHSHRLIILRRIWFLLGCLYYYRAVTMFITVLPKADPKYTCHPKLDNTTALPALVIAKRVLILISGMGLSINGKHIYCGDYIFSGHTMVLTMGYLVIKEYSPRRFFLLHWMSFFTSVIGVIMLLIARGHYSIDCLIGYYITTRLWYIYHTLAHSDSLKSRGRHNFLDKMWWWLIFRYFEKNIPGPLPRRYSIPLPRPLKRFFRRLYRNWWSSRRRRHQDQQQQQPPTTVAVTTGGGGGGQHAADCHQS